LIVQLELSCVSSVQLVSSSSELTAPELLGCAENALGLRPFLETKGVEFHSFKDKEHDLDKHLPTADVLITTPFWLAYVTRDRIASAPQLKLILTAGVEMIWTVNGLDDC